MIGTSAVTSISAAKDTGTKQGHFGRAIEPHRAEAVAGV